MLKLLRPVLFSILFVIAQVGVLVHAAEHAHHQAQTSCAWFLSAEHHVLQPADAITFHCEKISAPITCDAVFSVSLPLSLPYQTRAPPLNTPC